MKTIHSSHGDIVTDDLGHVVEVSSQEYKRIVRFDFKEYAACYGDELPDEFDILDLGYWSYEPAEPEFRERVKQILMIKRRIACQEAGYPASEACYGSIEEWEKATGRKFNENDSP